MLEYSGGTEILWNCRGASTKLSKILRDATDLDSYYGEIKFGLKALGSSNAEEGDSGARSMRLKGKVAVVTGAAVGLGRAVASRFAREGARVVAADINVVDGSALCANLNAQGYCSQFIKADVSKECEVSALFDTVVSRYGHVDVLYSNAAVLLPERDRPVHELSLETWDYVMGVNLRGSFLCARSAIASMLQNSGGSIIFLGSPTGLIGCAPELTAYSTSKAGVMGLMRVMAAAHARDKIRVNSIVPGTMDTPMNAYILADPSVRKKFQEAVPVGRLGTPQDIEGIALFLASDESSYCTGGLYMCDGGLTAA
jgi:NAD(P)-dependent dehydrogenase (short-subunit alcohol dehydrogenase family)